MFHLRLRLPAGPLLPASAAMPSCAAAAAAICAASVSSESPGSSSMTSPPPPSCDTAESAMADGAEVAAAMAAASMSVSASLAESGIDSPAVGGATLLLSVAESVAPEPPASSLHPSSSLQRPILMHYSRRPLRELQR